MTSELKVDKITPASGTNTQIGEAGDTTNLSAGTVTLPTSIITGASEKTTLVDADKFLIADSADSNAFKHVQKSNLPSGALVSLGVSDSTTNAANVVFDNVFSDTYSRYIIYIDTFLNASDGESFYFKFRKSDGSGGYEDEARTGYTYNIRYIRSGNNEYSDSASSGGAQTFGRLSGGVKNSTGEHGLKAILNVYRPATRQSQATMTYVTCNGTYRSYSNDSTMAGILMSNCNNYHTDAMLGIKFYYSSGDVDDHKIRVYGVIT